MTVNVGGPVNVEALRVARQRIHTGNNGGRNTGATEDQPAAMPLVGHAIIDRYARIRVGNSGDVGDGTHGAAGIALPGGFGNILAAPTPPFAPGLFGPTATGRTILIERRAPNRNHRAEYRRGSSTIATVTRTGGNGNAWMIVCRGVGGFAGVLTATIAIANGIGPQFGRRVHGSRQV